MSSEINLDSLNFKPDGIVVVVAPQAHWARIAEALTAPLPARLAHFADTPILFLEPGEKISSLSGADLAAAGLKRI